MTTPIFIKALKKPDPKKKPAPKGEPTKGPFKDLLARLAEHNLGGAKNETTVKKGHHISFKAGDFCGEGKVTSTGKDGCTCQDSTGRDHRVHWHEVTGHQTEKPKKNAAK
jgi:hypothetical protein